MYSSGRLLCQALYILLELSYLNAKYHICIADGPQCLGSMMINGDATKTFSEQRFLKFSKEGPPLYFIISICHDVFHMDSIILI